jgi:nucleoside-diphosphate-sugar epimerase
LINMKILITGARGFIGRHTIPLLRERGYEVYGIYYHSEPGLRDEKNVFWHKCNLLDPNEQKKLFEQIRPTHLLHFAWTMETDTRTSVENLRWVQASLELIMNFVSFGGKRAVAAGTYFEYDLSCEGYYSEETTPRQTRQLYGISKNSLQEIFSKYLSQSGISNSWVRIFHTYGPWEHAFRLVPQVITSLLRDQPVRCTSGEQIRDFIYVEDVASAFVKLLDSDAAGPVDVGSGRPVAVKTVVNTIADLLGKKRLVELGALPARLDESSFAVADTGKITQQIGWGPVFTLEEGLMKSIDWWKNELKK